ncbi:MAG: hypothetical protein ACLT5P_00630 [Flavonifractor plautii]
MHLDSIKRWYGLIGLLSLLGFVGVFTGERYSWAFLPAVDFQYFLPGLMRCRRSQILRSAARGFFAGMGVTAVGTLLLLALGGGTTEALYLSSGLGWGWGVAVYALPASSCGCREWWNARA